MWAALGNLLKNKLKKTAVNAAKGDDGSQKKILVLILIALFSLLIPFVIFIAILFGPGLVAKEYIENGLTYIEKISNVLTFKGWCSESDGSCEKQAEQKFNEKMDKVYKKYEKNNVDLDVDLITGTIFYGRIIDNSYLYETDENGHNQTFIKYFCDANAFAWAAEQVCEIYVENNYQKIYDKYYEKYLKIATNYDDLKESNCNQDRLINPIEITDDLELPITPLNQLDLKKAEACEFIIWNFTDLTDKVMTNDVNEQIYRNGKDDIEELAKQLVSGSTLNYDRYEEYLINTYIPDHYSKIYENSKDKEAKIKEIARDIMLYASKKGKGGGEFSSCQVVNTSCTGITISGGSYAGTYTLEEYIAGVVSHEVGAGWPDEAIKAQAIAARSFALKYTNNCTKTIANSQGTQTFEPPKDERIKNLVNETAGMVMTYNNDILNAEYSAWWGNNSSSSCGKYNDCQNGLCSIDLYKSPNKEKWTFTMPQNYFNYGQVTNNIVMSNDSIRSLGGHCRGMSQFGAKYLDLEKHYTYNQILETFYSDGVTLGTFGNNQNSCPQGSTSQGLIASNYKGFMQRVSAPTANDYYYSQQYMYASNVGQCVWYAKRRALEILNTVQIDENLKNQAVQAIKNTSGNGRDWWNNPSLTMFGTSTNYDEPKVGALIVWKYTNSNIKYMGADYGHIGVVEAVDYENRTMTVSDGWKNNWNNPNTIDYASFGFRTVPFEWAKNGGNPSKYIFLGYVYLLD